MMQKITFIFFLAFTSLIINAQSTYFDLGFKVQYGASILLNSAVTDNENYDFGLSNALAYGAKVGVHFESGSGFTLDVLRSSSNGSFTEIGADDVKTNWQAIDLYLAYRNGINQTYIELGPKISFIGSAERELTPTNEDVTTSFSSNEIAAMLGFGTYLIGSDGRFSGIFGFRIEYGLTDLIDSSVGQEQGAPVFNPSVYATEYKSTSPLFVGISFELNWGLGYYGKASCGQRGKFIWI